MDEEYNDKFWFESVNGKQVSDYKIQKQYKYNHAVSTDEREFRFTPIIKILNYAFFKMKK